MITNTYILPSKWKFTTERWGDYTAFYFRTWPNSSLNEPADLTIQISGWRLRRRHRPQDGNPQDMPLWQEQAQAAVHKLSIARTQQDNVLSHSSDHFAAGFVAVMEPISFSIPHLINHNKCPYDVELAPWPSNKPPRRLQQFLREDGAPAGCFVYGLDDADLWFVENIKDDREARGKTRRPTRKTKAPPGHVGRHRGDIWKHVKEIQAEYARQMNQDPTPRVKTVIQNLVEIYQRRLGSKRGISFTIIQRILRCRALPKTSPNGMI
jgi:hypothetical protein